MNTNGPARNPGGAIPVAHTPTISDATTLVLNDGQQQTATDPATIDASATPGGRFLYVQAGPGIVDEFAVTPAGTLTAIGSVTVPNGSGAEGIVAL